MFSLLWQRIRKAFTTLPTRRDYIDLFVVTVAFGAVAVPFGLWTGFLELTGPKDSFGILVAYSLVAFVLPGVAEELVFRVLPLPHPSEHVQAGKLPAAIIALILFVLWHPVNAYFFVPWARALFYRPDFLVVAGLLGIGATYLYYRSGSIWPGVIFHWAVDVAWKIGCGGRVITFGEPVG